MAKSQPAGSIVDRAGEKVYQVMERPTECGGSWGRTAEPVANQTDPSIPEAMRYGTHGKESTSRFNSRQSRGEGVSGHGEADRVWWSLEKDCGTGSQSDSPNDTRSHGI